MFSCMSILKQSKVAERFQKPHDKCQNFKIVRRITELYFHADVDIRHDITKVTPMRSSSFVDMA